jgi:hypothetical protein
MTSLRITIGLGTILLATGLAFGPTAAPAQDKPAGAEAAPVRRTEILDRAALDRLKRNSGLSLQWISWDNSRGHVRVEETDGLVRLRGSQQQRNGPGRLEIDGVVVRIDRTGFVFHGTVAMRQAPEDRAECLRNGTLTFRITGSRRYWRMQEMEACAGLTDYVDIYF